MKEYLRNFETLCTGNEFIYSQPEFRDFRQTIDNLTYFNSLKEFDSTQSRGVADVLNIFYRRILLQPYWYIEAKDRYPNDEKKQGQYLYDNIELAKIRFDSFGRGIFRIKEQLDELTELDPVSANILFKKILFISNDLLRYIGNTSFQILHCNLKETPLFIVLMEFIQEIRNRAGKPYYNEIDNYLNNIDSYNERFKIEIKPLENPKNNNTPPQLKTEYSVDQLKKIYSKLQGLRIVKSEDEQAFLGMFSTNFSGRVSWDKNIRGANVALFELMKKLTGKTMFASELKNYFSGKITDNNQNNSPTYKGSKIVNIVMEGI